MGIRFTGTNNQRIILNSPTNPTNGNDNGGPCTFMVWLKLDATSTPNAQVIVQNDDNLEMECLPGSSVINVWNGGSDTATSFTAVLGQWVHLCGAGTVAGAWNFYANGSPILALASSNNVAASGNSGLGVGNVSVGNEPASGVFSNLKVWRRILSVGEIRGEVYSKAPAAKGAYAWFPLTTLDIANLADRAESPGVAARGLSQFAVACLPAEEPPFKRNRQVAVPRQWPIPRSGPDGLRFRVRGT